MQYYAHSLEGEPPEKWQPLEEHLKNVAEKAADFARPFGGDSWARQAGKNHDLGKGTKSWQAYLRRVNEIIDEFAQFYDGHPKHAAEGARWLFKHSKEAGKILAYCIAGHHGGLPNWDDPGQAALRSKLAALPAEISFPVSRPELPAELPFPIDGDRFGFQLQFFTRMIFSCLVDADFLDTECFLDRNRASWRGNYPDIASLHGFFWKNFDKMRAGADPALSVNQQREKVLADCLDVAEQQPGIYTLTVPTGGGKTLASLAFALNHAIRYKKQRIIYVIPFTSIIEQNAKVFRDMLGDAAVLEHHCNFITDDNDWKSKLAAENWDAPIIVTTNVQFFDSFYANRTSRCRKLHNVANSVVIFDEVQAIPVEKLSPCLEVIRELSANYRVTTVLCTATQPAISFSEQFPNGLKIKKEIIHDVPALFANLKRTRELFVGTLNEEEVAARLMRHNQVLCIVNTRQQALDIFNHLPESEENIHLSALMHPVHRSRKLKVIRNRLKPENNQTCRVVSTQLIEAGVDVDFPAVFRTVAGIDSIAQAAGRCNRNGRSKTPCEVSVFALQENSECSFFRLAAQSSEKLFDRFAGCLTKPDCVRAYFEDYFWKNEQRMDQDGIIKNFCRPAAMGDIQFKDIACFQMINSATIPIIIALDEEARELAGSLKFAVHKGGILRKLQKYTVQIYPYQLTEIENWLESPVPEVKVLCSDELYSDTTGLQCSQPQGQAFFG
ncbi:MAG TPA: CRISPR-associated helicase Cas3' [Desulfobulbus sp.]|nr:CRISPR-associated helicase Cas3' [Desulfobulbus sp.]